MNLEEVMEANYHLQIVAGVGLECNQDILRTILKSCFQEKLVPSMLEQDATVMCGIMHTQSQGSSACPTVALPVRAWDVQTIDKLLPLVISGDHKLHTKKSVL